MCTLMNVAYGENVLLTKLSNIGINRFEMVGQRSVNCHEVGGRDRRLPKSILILFAAAIDEDRHFSVKKLEDLLHIQKAMIY